MREPRFSSDLAVSVVGTDTNGHRFKQTARVENISRRGGRLSEIRCLRAPGDVVEIQHRGTKANFRVVWIDVVSGRAGLCCVDIENQVWGTGLPFAAPGSEAQPGASGTSAPPNFEGAPQGRLAGSQWRSPTMRDANGKPQRRFPRYRCMAGVAAIVDSAPTKVWGRLNSISIGGCFIETTTPFKPQTRMTLLIGAHGLQVRVAGEVRYSVAGVGMGVAFTGISKADEKALEQLVATAAARQAVGQPASF